MPLFQQSVIKKHIDGFNTQHIEERWQVFKSIFHTAEKQQNIRNSKEEQYQEGFLRDLFVNVLGYTINPEPNFNLLTEQKNVNNSKKADGAIIVPQSNGSGSVVAVIELKGTETTDLNKIETQAFGYKNNQPGCNYVITSNFEKLRFYIDNTTQQEEFNLFTLTKAQFEILYACLAWESICKNMPTQLLNESVSKENTITKNLYKDYSEFKRALFANLVELNPHFDKLLLFKKTQKLLDRFLFIFFAEDRGLLPTNLIFRINQEWKNLQAMRIPVSLYERYKIYFNDLNHGAKVSLPAFGKKTGEAITQEFEIFAYNGGLFVSDEILDNIQIDDALLHLHSEKMSHYDFQSDVDVNILGHIFENSLNEIDEIKSEIEGNVLEKTKTRRKKDGVFYTPKYITKYIVDNTVGKLCTEKKEAIKLIDEDFITDKKLQTKTKKALLDKLNEYRSWLLDLTICDPACGSGAFLNQALEFLIAEHRYVDELQAKLLGDSLVLSDIENSILERNIYGVDLNDESVEIAKLSLWLRTAQKGRKLNSLNNNIKCGNSLIDEPAVAGDKAFSWENEFPEVFAKGGFDVVIGNPPYGAQLNTKEKDFLKIKYKTVHTRTPESFNYFVQQINMLVDKANGKWSIIIPSSFLNQHEFEKSRKFLVDTANVEIVVNLGDDVFQDVSTPTCIIIINHKLPKNILFSDLQNEPRLLLPQAINSENKFQIAKCFSNNLGYSFIHKQNSELIKKCYTNPTLKEVVQEVATGISSGSDKAYVFLKEEINRLKLEPELLKKMIVGGEINRYFKTPYSTKSILYITSEDDITQYPNVEKMLTEHKDTLKKRREAMNGTIKWYSLNWPRRKKLFENEKILIRQTASRILACYDKDQWYCLKSGLIVQLPEDSNLSYPYLTGVLNSKLLNFLYQDLVGEGDRIFPEVKPVQLFKLPIIDIDLTSDFEKRIFQKINTMVVTIELLHIERQNRIMKFTNYLDSKYKINKSKNLQNWMDMNFPDFIIELNKAIKAAKGTPLTKKDEFEWMDLFEENKKKALELKVEIDKTDKEIDAMVYELYGLSEEEIKIVENS